MKFCKEYSVKQFCIIIFSAYLVKGDIALLFLIINYWEEIMHSNICKEYTNQIQLAFLVVASVLALLLLAGCASSNNSSTTTQSNNDGVENPTESKPITYDKDKKIVKYLAEVNDIYFTEDTRHGIVYKGGSNGDKSV